MKITELATDETVLSEWGRRFARTRLEHNFTQAQLAEQAGVAKRTVERLENGEVGVRLWGLVRVCRALGLAERLDALLPEATAPGPVEQFHFQRKMRRRATGKRGHNPAPRRVLYSAEPETPTLRLREDPPRAWKWGDEQ